MPHRHSPQVLAGRRDRARRRGFLRRRDDGVAHVAVPARLAPRVKAVAASLEVHAAHVELLGRPVHFANAAAAAARPWLSQTELCEARRRHRAANAAKHRWEEALVGRWADWHEEEQEDEANLRDVVFDADPWAAALSERAGGHVGHHVRRQRFAHAHEGVCRRGEGVARAPLSAAERSSDCSPVGDAASKRRGGGGDEAPAVTDPHVRDRFAALERRLDNLRRELDGRVEELGRQLRAEAAEALSCLQNKVSEQLGGRVNDVALSAADFVCQEEMAQHSAALATLGRSLQESTDMMATQLTGVAVSAVKEAFAELAGALEARFADLGDRVEQLSAMAPRPVCSAPADACGWDAKPPGAPDVSHYMEPVVVHTGARVLVHGLTKTELNGRLGEVVLCGPERAGVILDGDARPIALKYTNLYAVGAAPPPRRSLSSSSREPCGTFAHAPEPRAGGGAVGRR